MPDGSRAADAADVAIRDVLADTGLWPRRHLRRIQGDVFVDGARVPITRSLPLTSEWRELEFRHRRFGARLALPPLVLVDKPVGVVTSRVDTAGGTTVFAWLDSPVAERVEAVGRLDRDTSGLLLLTGDGRLIQRLTHPRREVPRGYVAAVQGAPDPAELAALLAGTLVLRDGHRPAPLSCAPDAAGRWRITLTEGKYHEVRRIFAALGAPVVSLRRETYASYSLDDLQGAPWRRLGESEQLALYASLALEPPSRCIETLVHAAHGAPRA